MFSDRMNVLRLMNDSIVISPCIGVYYKFIILYSTVYGMIDFIG